MKKFSAPFIGAILCCILFLVVGIAACSSRPAVASRTTKAIVFVPGFKGSKLKDPKTDDTIWLSAYQVLLGSDSLALNHPGLPLKAPGRSVIPFDIIRDVPFFGVFRYTIYDSILEVFESYLGEKGDLFPFYYDWRLDLSDTAGSLSRFISKLRSEGYQDITLVGHGMGGLISAYYLRYGDQDVEVAQENWKGAAEVNRVILSGAPYRGAIMIFNDIQEGVPIVFNKDLLNSEALATFPASYQLLPGKGEGGLIDEELTPRDDLLYDGEKWKDHFWGLFSKVLTVSDEVQLNARVQFTQTALERAALFSSKITAPQTTPAKIRIPVLSLAGSGSQTMTKTLITKQGERVFTEEKLEELRLPGSTLYEDGDSIVPLRSASIPDSFKSALQVTERIIKANHGSVILGDTAQKEMLEFLDAT